MRGIHGDEGNPQAVLGANRLLGSICLLLGSICLAAKDIQGHFSPN